MAFRDPSYLQHVWRQALTNVQLCGSAQEWAERYRIISRNASANPGPWDTSLTPYLSGIMDAFSIDNPAWKIVVKKSNQIGGTEVLLNVLGYRIHEWPAPMMIVVPRNEDVAEYTESRIDPLLEECAVLHGLVGKTELGNEGADNVAVKRFPGGQLWIRGSKSRATYRSDPICVVFLDDLDAFGSNPEGDHAELAEKRTNTFSSQGRKIGLISTPTQYGSSLIEVEYQSSSQQLYYVPCLKCGAYQVLWQEYLKWINDDPQSAFFECQHCNGAIIEAEKQEMLRAGEWRADRPERKGTIEGFWIWAAYAPSSFRRWGAIAQSWIDATHQLRVAHNHAKMQSVLNLDWAKVFVPPEQVRLEGVEKEVFQRREHPFNAEELPLLCSTGGTDIQKDRIETSAYGWGVGDEAWLLDHAVHRGNPENPEVWNQWAEWVMFHQLQAVCVDANDNTDIVLDALTTLAPSLMKANCAVYAIRGMRGIGPLWPGFVRPGNIRNARCQIVSIHVDAGKDWLFGSLFRVSKPGPGFIHFDTNRDERFFKQLFAEREKGKDDSKTGGRYVKISGRNRNEALDCAVYARAAFMARTAFDGKLYNEVHQRSVSTEPRPAEANRRKPTSFRPVKKGSKLQRGVL